MPDPENAFGFTFQNKNLLHEALTHPSAELAEGGKHNQRLEFLGDAVVELITTEELFRRSPEHDEGRLTQIRAQIVSRTGLCQLAEQIGLGDHLILGRGEEINGGRQRDSNLADAFEALMGAIYLDQGFAAAQSYFLANFASVFDKENVTAESVTNPKGSLQEELQDLANARPTYELVRTEGPDHEKTYVVTVEWRGTRLGEGTGSSKKAAEAKAAEQALQSKKWLQA